MQTNEEIKKEFEELFDKEYPSVRSYTAGHLQDFVSDWWLAKIDELLKSQREELVEKIELCKIPSCDCCLQLRELFLIKE